MGRKAMELVEQMVEGLLSPTHLLKEVQSQLQAYDKPQLIHTIYRSPAPFRLMAQLTPAIARAARAGDEQALDIFRQAGKSMALQTKCQLERHGILPGAVPVVCAGGAWKAHEEMFRAFEDTMKRLCYGQQVVKPRYEQVCAGMVLHGLEKSMNRQNICDQMDKSCAQFRITW